MYEVLEKAGVGNVLFLVVIYNFGVGIDGHSARGHCRPAGLLKKLARRAACWALSKARGIPPGF